MPPISVNFEFIQHFKVPAKAAYAWATDYRPDDHELMGRRGRRKIDRICNDTLVLTDTIEKEDGGRVTKKRHIRLYPERLTWINTHISGPNRHSQFLYEITPEGRNSSLLRFTGREIRTAGPTSARQLAALVAEERKEDSALWKMLARAMEADLGRAKRR
jgi:hypothetical protein